MAQPSSYYGLRLQFTNSTQTTITYFRSDLNSSQAYPPGSKINFVADTVANGSYPGIGDGTGRVDIGFPSISGNSFLKYAVTWRIDYNYPAINYQNGGTATTTERIFLETTCPFLTISNFSQDLQFYQFDPSGNPYVPYWDLTLAFTASGLVPLVFEPNFFTDKLLQSVARQTLGQTTAFVSTTVPYKVVAGGGVSEALQPNQRYLVDRTTLAALTIVYTFPNAGEYSFRGYSDQVLASGPLFMTGWCSKGVAQVPQRLTRRLLMLMDSAGGGGYRVSLSERAVTNGSDATLLLTLPDQTDTNGSKVVTFPIPADNGATAVAVATADLPFVIIRFLAAA